MIIAKGYQKFEVHKISAAEHLISAVSQLFSHSCMQIPIAIAF